MYYLPKLADGRMATLPWEVRLFYFSAWPLSVSATTFQRFIDILRLTFSFLAIFITTEAEYNMIIQNRHDPSLVFEALPEALVCTELILRIYNMVLNRAEFKTLIKEFYAEIYFERTPVKEFFYDGIRRMSIPAKINVFSFLSTLLSIYAGVIFTLFKHQRELPWLLQPHYDYHPWILYLLTLFLSLSTTTVCILHQTAESFLIVLLILYINARYLILQRDLRELYENSKQSATGIFAPELSLSKFHAGLTKIMHRNTKLNKFAKSMQQQYSFRFFIMMGLSTLLICVLGLKILIGGLSSDNVTFVLWLLCKTGELIVYGNVGSTIIETTDKMSYAYYASNWEQIILDSQNAKRNKELMKDISIAIELSQNPISFSGFDFFKISLPTVASILKGAGSYFTSFCALRQ